MLLVGGMLLKGQPVSAQDPAETRPVTPYLVDLTGQYLVDPLLTVGDEVPLLEGPVGSLVPSSSQTFAMAGIPDGLGLYETENAYFVYMNHELRSSQTTKLSSTVSGQIKGARVSLFQFTKDWEMIGGKNLIENVVDHTITYTLNLTSGNYEDNAGNVLNDGANLSRFCSGYLATTGFRDQNGASAPIWFAPEETGSSGRGWAVFLNGSAVPIDGLGRYSKEQVLAASQYRADNSDTTLLFGTEDDQNGEIYMFVGQQTLTDTNGFSAGDLYVLQVEDSAGTPFDYETMPEDTPLVGKWTPVPDSVALADGDTLSDWVDAAGRSTNFRRPEDIHEDPNAPGTFYFATTGHANIPTGSLAPDNFFGKLHRFTLNPTDPTDEMVFEYRLNGGPDTGVSYDNLTVDSQGRVLIQEDRTAGGRDVMAAQMRHARILAYNIISDTTEFWFETNQATVDPGSATNYGNWETSGIIEVAADSYLVSVQAHSLPSTDYVQGGQLVLTRPTQHRLFLPLIVKS